MTSDCCAPVNIMNPRRERQTIATIAAVTTTLENAAPYVRTSHLSPLAENKTKNRSVHLEFPAKEPTYTPREGVWVGGGQSNNGLTTFPTARHCPFADHLRRPQTQHFAHANHPSLFEATDAEKNPPRYAGGSPLSRRPLLLLLLLLPLLPLLPFPWSMDAEIIRLDTPGQHATSGQPFAGNHRNDKSATGSCHHGITWQIAPKALEAKS